jgi:hypothetical protein
MSPTAPMIDATAPQTISQMLLSVGVPVKVRDTSEPKEFEALKPKISTTIPTTRRARDTDLFMMGVGWIESIE